VDDVILGVVVIESLALISSLKRGQIYNKFVVSEIIASIASKN